MTWQFASDIITRLMKGSAKDKAEAILYINFNDYIALKEMCDPRMIKKNTICGVEVKPTYKCPAGQIYIRKKDN